MVPCDRILQTAREQNVDVIGLSGLITPSLDEMSHVAREMEREGFELPLLIGGATTSRAHTAIKIAQHYSKGVFHVLDASRAVGVVGSLISEENKKNFFEQNLIDQEEQRRLHASRREQRETISLAEARRRAQPIEWGAEEVPAPSFTGVRVLDDGPRLSAGWLEQMRFLSSYYQRPLGETVAGALPARLRSLKPLPKRRKKAGVRSWASACE